MRTLPFVLAIFISFSFTDNQKTKKIIGYWEIYKIEKSNEASQTERNKYLHFHENGVLEGGGIGKSPNKSGTWKIDAKSNTLMLQSERDNNDELGAFTIIQLTQKELVIEKDVMRVYLEKVESP
ncbi:lipocalin family protein [Flagellimonas marina]|uniref:Lipocalin family protein n=1 Tax=Flagellimonas marina TaxID=1775168 RepID=A0ABV8PNH9_9FLAO